MDESTQTGPAPIDYSRSLQIFFLLQFLDVLTTLTGFHRGLKEASPFIQLLMRVGPVAGLLGSKILAVALGAVCVWRGRFQVIHMINYWYVLLVIWNFTLIVTR